MKELADEVSECVRYFEDYLAHLPGRVVAETWIAAPDSPDGGDFHFGIQLGRDGKAWKLFCSLVEGGQPDYDGTTPWKPLSQASLTHRKWAISMFPALFDAIISAQDDKVTELEKVVADFDAFAEEIGMSDRNELRRKRAREVKSSLIFVAPPDFETKSTGAAKSGKEAK
ncbi:MAG TPA: hypothetical protein VFC46_04695 [Humisphaera sp.]|nr:hypothetical protein [Humisphaera sp.]